MTYRDDGYHAERMGLLDQARSLIKAAEREPRGSVQRKDAFQRARWLIRQARK